MVDNHYIIGPQIIDVFLNHIVKNINSRRYIPEISIPQIAKTMTSPPPSRIQSGSQDR